MPADSIYRAAFLAANVYREEIAARLGVGAADQATREWNQQRFWVWLSDRVIEHAVGEKQWLEFGPRNFSRVGTRRPELQMLVDEMRAARKRLGGEPMLAFAEKEKLTARVAALANELLE